MSIVVLVITVFVPSFSSLFRYCDNVTVTPFIVIIVIIVIMDGCAVFMHDSAIDSLLSVTVQMLVIFVKLQILC
eukprot:12413971-Karenia_brevis.AAC.1